MVSVVAALVSVETSAHQDRTGICAPSSWSTTLRKCADLVLEAGEALHQGNVAERVGGVLRQIRIITLNRSLQRFGPPQHQDIQHDEDEAQRDQQKREPPIQIQRGRGDQHGDCHQRNQVLAEEAEP